MNGKYLGFLGAMILLAGISCNRPQEPAATQETATTGEVAGQPAAEPPATPAAPPAAAPVSRPARTTGQRVPPAARPEAQAPVSAAVPQTPPAPRTRTYTVPEGTAIKVRTTSALSTKDAQAGTAFTGSLAEPLMAGGTVVAPKGALVHGRVAESDPGGRVSGRARISVRLATLELENGNAVPISTNTIAQEAASSKKKDAIKVGVGAGLGAAIGAIAGGGKGAGIGAAAGAGAGTGTVLATRGDAATIPAETVLTFTLNSPVTVTK